MIGNQNELTVKRLNTPKLTNKDTLIEISQTFQNFYERINFFNYLYFL